MHFWSGASYHQTSFLRKGWDRVTKVVGAGDVDLRHRSFSMTGLPDIFTGSSLPTTVGGGAHGRFLFFSNTSTWSGGWFPPPSGNSSADRPLFFPPGTDQLFLPPVTHAQVETSER